MIQRFFNHFEEILNLLRKYPLNDNNCIASLYSKSNQFYIVTCAEPSYEGNASIYSISIWQCGGDHSLDIDFNLEIFNNGIWRYNYFYGTKCHDTVTNSSFDELIKKIKINKIWLNFFKKHEKELIECLVELEFQLF